MYFKYVIIFLGIHTVTSKHVKFYRKDYTYVFDYDAFYKLHVDNNTSWNTAFLTCENEDAKLFYPSEAEEWRIVNKLREEMAETANVTDVLIGVHNKFNVGEFLTVDGDTPPIPMGDDLSRVEEGDACVTMDSDTGSYEKGPCTRSWPTLFICKKMDTQPCPTTTCPTIDPDYKFSPQTKKCYKVNKSSKQWQDAMQTCYMEGGLLAVAEDTTRVGYIRNVIELEQYNTYFIGIRDLFNNGKYYTVEGKNIGKISHRTDQTDVVSRYSSYNNHRTQSWNKRTGVYNSHDTGLETGSNTPIPSDQFGCGVLTYQTIETASCYKERPFICEMDASN